MQKGKDQLLPKRPNYGESKYSYGTMKTIFVILGTVPTFVSAHTSRESRKSWFKRARAGVNIDAINYANTTKIKIKAKFFYCDQIKLNEPVLKPETPE